MANAARVKDPAACCGVFDYIPAPSRIYLGILDYLSQKITTYIDRKKCGCKIFSAPFAVKLFENSNKTIVSPDISVVCDPNKLIDQGCVGAPDWIIEIISFGNPSIDYIDKLKLYANDVDKNILFRI